MFYALTCDSFAMTTYKENIIKYAIMLILNCL